MLALESDPSTVNITRTEVPFQGALGLGLVDRIRQTSAVRSRGVWQAPPGWPPPPSGWHPPAGWVPDPAWPAPPEDWQWVVAPAPLWRRVAAYVLVLALVVAEAIVVYRVTAWAYTQPASVDTQTPAVHWLFVLAGVALAAGIGLGLLLGAKGGWPGGPAVLSIVGVAGVAFFASVASSNAQPCSGPACDIAGAPAATATVAALTAAMLAALAVGYCLAAAVLAGRRRMEPRATA